ncbi:hypothetical protein HYT57_02800 [Candidatus Woesearchaeota archaeon]|nr:hypothetical protein [Candidatus Woesearchaeota archaeon]
MEKVSSSERVISRKEVNGLPKPTDSPQALPAPDQSSVPQGGLEIKLRKGETIVAKSGFGDVATVSDTSILKAKMRTSGTYNEWDNSSPKLGEIQATKYQTTYM